MPKANQRIRNALKQHGVFQWQLAEELDIGEYTLTKKLRKELSAEDQSRILQIIENMGKGKPA